MSLMQKLLKNSKNNLTSAITESKVYKPSDMVDTGIPALNIACSGRLDGGISPGLLMIAGNSKHFKTGFALVMASAYQKHFKDGALLFYDSEFGAPESYMKAFGVDMDRVVHTPIFDVEQLKFDILGQLQGLDKSDHALILIDSVGNLASKKEVEDTEQGKSTADMTRAKQFKSLGRIITPYLKIKEVPVIAINHIYKEIGPMYPKDVPGGGTGLYYSSNDVWIIGRQKDKDGKELQGFNFTINIDKSRYVREGAKIPISISFENGIDKWSGLFDIAMAGGFIRSEKQGWYLIEDSDKSYRKSDIESNDTYWEEMIENPKFKQYVIDSYKLEHGKQKTVDLEEEMEYADE